MLKHVIGQKEQVKELGRIAKMWQDPKKYEATFEQKILKRILIVGEDDFDRKEITDHFIEEAGRITYYPQEEERKTNDFQGWVKHTTAYALSIALRDNEVSVAVLEDVDRVMDETEKDQPRSPLEALEFEVSVLRDSLACVVMTAASEKPFQELIDKGFFDRVIRLSPRSARESERAFRFRLCEAPVKDIDYAVIASILVGKPISYLDKAMTVASEIAFAAGRASVTMHDLVDACLELVHDAKDIPDRQKAAIPYAACHEAGHAIVAEALRPGSVAVASIRTYLSRIAGVTTETYPDERWDSDLDQRINIRVMLAGKAAVKAMYNVLDIGSTFDIKMAKIAESRRVEKYEENSFLDLYTRAKDIGGTGTLSDDFDRKTRPILSKEYSEILRFFSYESVKRCLEALSQALISKGTLLGSEIRAIMEENPIDNTCIEMFKMDE